MSKRMDKKELIESLKGLIVSCQTQPDDPIHTDKMVVKMAEAAKWGGAVGIRANSPEQIAAIKAEVDLPIIGLDLMIGDGEYVLAEVNAFPGMPGRKMMDAYASVIDDFMEGQA